MKDPRCLAKSLLKLFLRAIKDEDIANELHDKDFTDITMPTGHDAAKFAHLPWPKTAGKEPPWAA